MSLWGFSKISRQARQIVAHCWEKHCWTKFAHHVNLILKARPATCSSVFSTINPGDKIIVILLHCVRLHLLVSAFHLQPFLLRALRSASQTCFAWLLSTVSAGKYLFCSSCSCTWTLFFDVCLAEWRLCKYVSLKCPRRLSRCLACWTYGSSINGDKNISFSS